jgi:hypothetical protein
VDARQYGLSLLLHEENQQKIKSMRRQGSLCLAVDETEARPEADRHSQRLDAGVHGNVVTEEAGRLERVVVVQGQLASQAVHGEKDHGDLGGKVFHYVSAGK